MLNYVLIGLCFALVGVAGLQFMYMFYLDRLDNERKKRIAELERHCKKLSVRLAEAEDRIGRQNAIIEDIGIDTARSEETWADVLEES